MASTLIIYQGTGSQTDYTVPFDYLKKSFVTVSLQGELLTGGDYGDTGADYFFVDKTTIRLKVAPPEGQFLTVRRYTSQTERVVTFKDASVLKANDLDTSQLQAFHIAAEARDVINDALIQNNQDNWDAKNKRIVRVADPIEDGDAVNYGVYKEDAQGAYQSRLGAEEAQRASQAAQQAAQTAQRASQTAQVMAQTAQQAAQTAQATTQAARDVAVQAREDLQEARDAAILAKDQAQTARTQAQSAQAFAQTARAQAQSAQASAQSARDSASASQSSAASSATTSQNWAIKMDGPVSGSQYSAKYHASQAQATVSGGVDAINTARDQAVTTVRSEGTTQVNLAKAQVTKAAQQASIATSKATEASQSATSASTSASNALASETNAKTSQTNAKTSQTNAAGSASSASGSAQSASTSASQASESATSASQSAQTAYDEAERARQYAESASVGQIQTDWNQTDSGAVDYIKNKPTLGALSSKDSLDYSDLTGTPPAVDLSPYATKVEVTEGLASKQPVGDYATNTALTQGLAGKQPTGDYATNTALTQGLAGKLGVNDKAASATSADSVAWTGVTGAPSTFPPSSHRHSTTEVDGLDSYVTQAQLEEAVRSSAGLPLGHHYAWPFQTVPANSIQCNGATYNRALYADFFAYATEQGWVKTESEWQSIARSNGGYCAYYSDGDGSTTFRTPKFAPFMQIAIASGNVGNYHEAGLPNITGSAKIYNGATAYGGIDQATGAFVEGPSFSSHTFSETAYSYDKSLLQFKASSSNNIYGNSSTVQPESTEWMICVVVMGAATNVGSADVSNVMQAVAQVQAEVGAIPTPNAYITETWKSGSSWYRVWSDGFIEQGVTYTRAATNDWSGAVTLVKSYSNTNYSVVATSFRLNNEDYGRDTTTDVYGKTTSSVYCSWYGSATGSTKTGITLYCSGY